MHYMTFYDKTIPFWRQRLCISDTKNWIKMGGGLQRRRTWRLWSSTLRIRLWICHGHLAKEQTLLLLYSINPNLMSKRLYSFTWSISPRNTNSKREGLSVTERLPISSDVRVEIWTSLESNNYLALQLTTGISEYFRLMLDRMWKAPLSWCHRWHWKTNLEDRHDSAAPSTRS